MSAPDSDTKSLYYKDTDEGYICIVGPGVESIVNDDRYFFVKMTGNLNFRSPKPKIVTTYFIVPICYECKDVLKLNQRYGPYQKESFDSACVALNIVKQITFPD
jgi:hypothetical protein